MGNQVVTIERTSKRIKLAKVIGWALFVWSWLVLGANCSATGPDPADHYIGLIMFWGGLGLIVWARSAKWWYHG
jgi:hypothetical protein